MKARKPVGGTIADRLKAFEATASTSPPPAVVPIPPPPPPRSGEEKRKKKKSKSKDADIPGSFPGEEDDHFPNDNDIVGIIDMAPPKSKKDKKSSRSRVEGAIPMPPPPPPVPAAPDVPYSLPFGPESKESKKERPKANRDAGSAWGIWGASTPIAKEQIFSSQPQYDDEPRREHKSRSPEKEGRPSASRSTSDKEERAERVKDKVKMAPGRPKLMNVFSSTPPISRTTSTRDKRHKESRSSRRPSIDVTGGMVSPLSEPEMPTMSSKAAKILGVSDSLGRSRSKRMDSFRPADEEDIVMVGANDAAEPSPDRPSRRRPKVSHMLPTCRGGSVHSDNASEQQYPRDDDLIVVDADDAAPTPGLKRSSTSASAKKGLGGLFGGILSTPKAETRPEPQRRRTHHTTDAEDGAMTDADAAARKAIRRARRAEREAAEKTPEKSRSSKDPARREKRRKHDEEAEAQRQAEREARRAERRADRAREEEDRRAAEEKDAAREERKRQKRFEREQEREREHEPVAANGDTAVEDEEARRAARRERRKARAAESDREHGQRRGDDDEERRRRRAERHAAREVEGKSSSRRRTEQAADDFVYPRPPKVSRRHTDGPDKPSKKHDPNPPSWPHSGTSSWVKDHIGAGPPPDDGAAPNGGGVDDFEDAAAAARREGMRRRKTYGDGVVDVEVPVAATGERRRRKRREGRTGASDGSGDKKKNVVLVDNPSHGHSPTTPRGGGGGGGWWKKLTGYG